MIVQLLKFLQRLWTENAMCDYGAFKLMHFELINPDKNEFEPEQFVEVYSNTVKQLRKIVLTANWGSHPAILKTLFRFQNGELGELLEEKSFILPCNVDAHLFQKYSKGTIEPIFTK